MILNDEEIAYLATEKGMIDPYHPRQVSGGVVSYGQGSFGYDLRLGSKFKVFDSPLGMYGMIIDPKSDSWHNGFTEYDLTDPKWAGQNYITIPANSFALGESVETLDIPRGVTGVAIGKSTYARAALIANVTPLEAGWRGKVTIEMSNTAPLPVRVYAGEGVIQILFFRGNPCRVSYADRQGKYQDQRGLTLPSVLPAPKGP